MARDRDKKADSDLNYDGRKTIHQNWFPPFFKEPKRPKCKTTFYVRFGEEELNKSDHDNQGKVCFDAYALYTLRPAIHK